MVIPTCGRPALAVRAVRSALDQTHPPHEVVVVADGADEETERAVAAVGSPKVRFAHRATNGGASAARNAAIAIAEGDWIALLDDDDLWDREKLAKQVALLHAHDALAGAVVFGQQRMSRSGGRTVVRPRVVPDPAVGIDDYLFARSGGRPRGTIHTSTILAPRSYFTDVPFRAGLLRHEDWQWLLDVERRFNPRFLCVLSVVTHRDRRGLSRDGGFDELYQWYLSNRERLAPASRLGFVVDRLSSRAAHARQFTALPLLVGEFLRQGGWREPRLLALLAWRWLAPRER